MNRLNFTFMLEGPVLMLRTALLVFALLAALGQLPAAAQKDAPPIQDNSFLVEEAYNQEKGIVQHISSFSYYADSGDWFYTFTQEWPMGGQRNQFSYSLSAVRPGGFASQGPGIGDVFLNYRLQALGNGETRVAFSPRLSAILPSGDSNFGRGYGGAGVQTNLPVSLVLHPKLVSHWNAGTTYIPHARNSAREEAAAWSYNAGQSFIWLVNPRFNVMFETFFVDAQTVTAPGRTEWSKTLLLNPGFRWAYNFSNGLQIVPGLAMPIGVGPSAGEKGVFIYLSFEHPFLKNRD